MLYPPADLCFVEPQVFRAEGHVLFHGLLEQLVLRILENQSNFMAYLDQGFLFLGKDVRPIKQNGAASGLKQPVEVLDQGGFSRAGMADESHKLAVLNVQVDVFQCLNLKGGARGGGLI